MCYSFKTSIISYIIGMLSGLFALYTNQIILGILILCYCQMQLAEAFIWKGIDTNNEKWNERGTAYGKYILPTHNIAISIAILIIFGISTPSNLLPLICSLFFYTIILYIYSIYPHPNKTYPFIMCSDRSCQNDKNRLQWPFPTTWYLYSFILSIILISIYVKSLVSKLFLLFFFIITYLFFLFKNPNTMSSMWCFYSAILAPFIVIGNYFLTRK